MLWDPKCPSAGYQALYQHFSVWWSFPDSNPISFEVQDITTRKLIYAIDYDNPDIDTWSFTAHAATATLHDAMQDIYVRALYYLENLAPKAPPQPRNLLRARTQSYTVETRVPLVRAVCHADEVQVKLDDTIALRFPVLQQSTSFGASSDYAKINVTSALRHYAAARGLNTSDPTAVPPVLVVPLELPDQSGASIGLAVFKQNDTASPVFWTAGCVIDARWASALSIIEGMRIPLFHEFWRDRSRNLVQTTLDFDEIRAMGFVDYTPSSEDSGLKHIEISRAGTICSPL